MIAGDQEDSSQLVCIPVGFGTKKAPHMTQRGTAKPKMGRPIGGSNRTRRNTQPIPPLEITYFLVQVIHSLHLILLFSMQNKKNNCDETPRTYCRIVETSTKKLQYILNIKEPNCKSIIFYRKQKIIKCSTSWFKSMYAYANDAIRHYYSQFSWRAFLIKVLYIIEVQSCHYDLTQN